MKKYFSVSVSVLILIFLLYYFYILINNQKKEKELLTSVDSIIEKDVVNFNSNIIPEKIDEREIFSKNKIEEDNHLIGKIIIKKIGIEAPIMDGTTQDILKVAVGHFQRTSYWDGNVVLASHNRGSYAHYFEKINKLEAGDEIIYQTKLGTRLYTVNEVNQIKDDNWEPLKKTENNMITLITCITNKPDYRLCVKAIQNI